MNALLGFLKSHKGTLFYSAVMLIFCMQRHTGFMVFGFGGFGLLFVLAGLLQFRRDRERRLRQCVAALLILASAGVIAGWHAYLAHSVRQSASSLVAEIERYHQTQGEYPPDIEKLGWDKVRFRKEFGFSNYHLEKGRPDFFYAATFVPFNTCGYDFSARSWMCAD